MEMLRRKCNKRKEPEEMLKKLRVKKINAASHGVVDVSERWVCVRMYAPAGTYQFSYNTLVCSL